MTQEEWDKRVAAAVSVSLHVIVFGLLAAGGMFTFLQSHSQAPPVDVTVYNEESPEDTPAAGNGEPASNGGGGGGETYRMPQEHLPAIRESYTQEVQEQREIKKVMQTQGISEEQATAVVAAKRDVEKPIRDTVFSNNNSSDTTANTTSGDGLSGPEPLGPGNNSDAAPGLGTDATGNSQGGDPSGDRHSEGKRPATKAHLISQPDVSAYYPQDLRKKNVTGTVTVHVVITADGTVCSASVSGSSGYASMDAAAVQIAYQCQYEPARNEQGEAVAAERNLQIPFVLQ